MTSVMGLDLSLTSTGVSYPDGDVATITTGLLRGEERLVTIRDWITGVCDDWAPDLVAIEGPAFARPNGMHALGGLAWIVYVALWERELIHVEVPPSCVKKYATGNGNAKKVDMLAAAWKRLDYDGTDDNQADALWLRATVLAAVGEPVVDMPQVNQSKLDVVRAAIEAVGFTNPTQEG